MKKTKKRKIKEITQSLYSREEKELLNALTQLEKNKSVKKNRETVLGILRDLFRNDPDVDDKIRLYFFEIKTRNGKCIFQCFLERTFYGLLDKPLKKSMEDFFSRNRENKILQNQMAELQLINQHKTGIFKEWDNLDSWWGIVNLLSNLNADNDLALKTAFDLILDPSSNADQAIDTSDNTEKFLYINKLLKNTSYSIKLAILKKWIAAHCKIAGEKFSFYCIASSGIRFKINVSVVKSLIQNVISDEKFVALLSSFNLQRSELTGTQFCIPLVYKKNELMYFDYPQLKDINYVTLFFILILSYRDKFGSEDVLKFIFSSHLTDYVQWGLKIYYGSQHEIKGCLYLSTFLMVEDTEMLDRYLKRPMKENNFENFLSLFQPAFSKTFKEGEEKFTLKSPAFLTLAQTNPQRLETLVYMLHETLQVLKEISVTIGPMPIDLWRMIFFEYLFPENNLYNNILKELKSDKSASLFVSFKHKQAVTSLPVVPIPGQS